LFGQIQEELAVAILLATLGCLPARCQSTEDLAIRQVQEAPASHLNESFCFPPRSKVCSGLTSTDPQSAPVPSSDGAFKKSLKRLGKDQWGIYSAPLHRSNLKWDALFLAGTGVLIATDRQASRAVSGNHINVSQGISDAGLYGTSAAAGALLLSSLATHNEHAREAGILSAEAFANSVPIYGILQLTTGRERPDEASGNGRFWQNNALNSSFPSGHAVFTWAMASVIAHEYPRPWVKWLVYGTATAVSVTRFSGREHFPSDIVVGSVIGYLVGRHIFLVHCREGLSEDCHPPKISAAEKP
jgi:membrane-associated phospholipid phosphatase